MGACVGCRCGVEGGLAEAHGGREGGGGGGAEDLRRAGAGPQSTGEAVRSGRAWLNEAMLAWEGSREWMRGCCRVLACLLALTWRPFLGAGHGGELHPVGGAAPGHQRAGKHSCQQGIAPWVYCLHTRPLLCLLSFSLSRAFVHVTVQRAYPCPSICGLQVASFRADGPERAFAQQEFGLKSFPTIVLFPRRAQSSRSRAFVTYPSERRDPASLLAFVSAIAGPIGETWSGP